MASAPLSHVSEPNRDVRPWPGVCVHLALSASDRIDAERLAAMVQYNGDQCCNHDSVRNDDVDGRRSFIPDCAIAHHASRVVVRRLAVLCPTPVRGYVLGARRRLDAARGGAARQFAL